MMKKWLSLLLALCVCLTLGACSKDNDADDDTATATTTAPTEEEAAFALPHGLAFGMTYDEAKAAYALLPEIAPADANDGYFGTGYALDFASIDTAFGLTEETCDLLHSPYTGFSFNENKELYEYYLILSPQSYYVTNVSEESAAEQALDEIYTALDEKLDGEVTESETDTGITVKWDSDSLVTELYLTWDEDDNFQIMLVMHCKTYELK